MSLLSFIGKAATGFVTGGVGGAVLGAASALAGSGGGGTTNGFVSKYSGITASGTKMPGSGAPSLFPAGLPSPDSVKVTASGTNIGGIYQSGTIQGTAYFPGGVQPLGPAGGFGSVQSGSSSTAAACTLGSGTHLNRTGYFLKSGQYIAPGTKCVKNRRRNPLNPRALSRAMGRLASAKRAAKALDRFEVKGRRCR